MKEKRKKTKKKKPKLLYGVGSKNWLCLCFIISSSFLMFLLLMGIVTRYCIYSIEQNNGKVYDWTFKVLWFMFLACGGISACSSAVFVWCKRLNDLESKKISNVQVSITPPSSSSTRARSEERELESFPHQTLMEATKVHFGARPNLKKILYECKGEDVGVMVCGPRSMRHQVAEICASSSAHNLHFESISFDW